MLPTIHTALLTSLINVCLILLVTIILNSLLRSFIRIPKKLDTRRGRTYVSIVRSTISIILFAVALHIIFILLGINIAPLLASAGIIGITIGIGARPLVEDLVTGLFLLSQNSIAVGDYVRIDDIEGTIEAINFRTLDIRAENGALAIIPNSQVKKVVNFSRYQ